MKNCFGKRICALLALALSLTALSPAMGETTLYLAGADQNSAEYKLFTQAHPELTVNTETNLYLSTDEIISAFLISWISWLGYWKWKITNHTGKGGGVHDTRLQETAGLGAASFALHTSLRFGVSKP